MIIKDAKFVKSSALADQCPQDNLPEYAFIGRSNVGKSSLINMLCQQNMLAKTSGKPGKTRLINHFLINNAWYLVDLPGYGYAQASKIEQEKIEKVIASYLKRRTNLTCLFVLIDSRHPTLPIDHQFIASLGEAGVPFCIVLTKIDKLSKSGISASYEALRTEMLKTWESLPDIFLVSSEKKLGKTELLDYIEQVNSSL